MNTLNEPSLRRLFLGRLSLLLVKEMADLTPEEQRLINRAIVSTYKDCRELGLEPEARRILAARRPKT